VSWQVPLTDVKVPEEDVQAVLDTYRSGWLTMGPRIQEFEAAFAAHCTAQHAVSVSSGTAALHLAMLALGVGPGDEVIVPDLTFVAGAAAARYCGADVVLCDIHGPYDFNLDPEDVAARITPRTKAILAVHFMGYPADLEALRGLGPVVIEDAAQAVAARGADGRPIGADSVAACFSFFSKKQLCVGEGGAVTTNDPEVERKVRSLRSHAMASVTWDRHRGHAESYDIVDIGFNFRMDEPRAALGLARLPRLDADIASRRAQVRMYRERLAGIPGVEIPWTDDDVERSSHFCFPVLLPDEPARDHFREQLAADGIQTTWYPAITTFSEYSDHGSRPRAEEVAGRHTALPLASSFGEREVELVVAAVRRAVG
jgi:dTDP-4-amino-4,6-dideoxygalactose transaminase